MIKSQTSEDHSYVVDLRYFSCDCRFYEYHSFCKHIFACEALAGNTASDDETEAETETDDEDKQPPDVPPCTATSKETKTDIDEENQPHNVPPDPAVPEDATKKIDTIIETFVRYRSYQEISLHQQELIDRVYELVQGNSARFPLAEIIPPNIRATNCTVHPFRKVRVQERTNECGYWNNLTSYLKMQ
jgi:hypothetical protein